MNMSNIVRLDVEHIDNGFHVYAFDAHGICHQQAPYFYVQRKGSANVEGTKAHAQREALKTAEIWRTFSHAECKVITKF